MEALRQKTTKYFTKKNVIIFIAQLLGLLLFATIYFLYLHYNNIIPQGTDVWGHVYKAQHMYNSIKDGCWYPLYDMYWYNGIETFRYWGPVSYYFYCIPLFLTGGNTVLSYQLYLCLMILLGGIPWLFIGIESDHKWFGLFAGIMWFMLPSTNHILIAYGNVPQIATIMMTPYLIWFLKKYLVDRKDIAAIGLVLTMTIMTATHLMLAGITGLSTFLYLLIDSIFNKDVKRKFSSLAYMVCGILIMSIWFIPALKGGMINSNDSGLSAAEVFVTDLRISLDPISRFIFGWRDFYFGISLIVISVFGIIASNKKNKAGFIFLLLVMFMTSPTAFKILSKVPMSGLFWMERFTPIAYGFFMFSIFEWSSIKKKFIVILAVLLALDSVPFYSVNMQNFKTSQTVVEDVDILNGYTTNRASLMELSSYGPYPSYQIPNSGHLYSFGWAWQGAITADNIMNLNESLEASKFLYMFDRSIELGDDAILVGRDRIMSYDIQAFIEAADRTGYELVDKNSTSYFFVLKNRPEGKCFGVKTKYQAMTIGKFGSMFVTRYPAFTTGNSNFIDDYSFEELSSYKTLFLTGFEYHDKAVAEKLIKDLSDAGVRIIIDASHLPTDSTINENYFMGVVGSRIQFTNRYPALFYNKDVLYASDFSGENANFSTEYISGTDNVLGYFIVDDTKFTFLGTNKDCPNVYFLGINLVYEAMDTEDEVLYSIADELFQISRDELPLRTLVPIKVDFDNSGLRVESPDDGVNTTIAFADCFKSEQEIAKENNLLVVNNGVTEITYEYAMLKEGSVASIVGIILTLGWTLIVKKSKQFD